MSGRTIFPISAIGQSDDPSRYDLTGISNQTVVQSAATSYNGLHKFVYGYLSQKLLASGPNGPWGNYCGDACGNRARILLEAHTSKTP